MSRRAALIFSPDPLAAALIGAAVEFAGHTPHFARPDEPAREALLRVRPKLAIIDCDHEDACSEGFVGPALMTGARVILLRSRRTKRVTADFAVRLGLPVIELPSDEVDISVQLKTLLED